MYTEFKNVKNIMKFLKENTYGHVEKDIWDCNLWFYGKVENLNNKIFYTDKLNNTKMYKFQNKENVLNGIAVVSYNKFCINIYVDLLEDIDLYDFLMEVANENKRNVPIVVNCCRDYIAQYIVKKFNGALKERLNMYYCLNEKNKEDLNYNIVELTEKDERYFEYNWHQIKASMEQGIRFFSIIDNDKIISLAGLAPFSATRAEIVCVKTQEKYRNKGFSKALCTYVISEGFKDYDVLTWTTNANNKKSISLSNKLDFKHLINTYQIVINRNYLA